MTPTTGPIDTREPTPMTPDHLPGATSNQYGPDNLYSPGQRRPAATAAGGGTARLMLRITAMSDPVARALEQTAIAEYAVRYGKTNETPLPGHALSPPFGQLLVGWIDGDPVGCGGWRWASAGVAELRRLYVVRGARRHGVATSILDAVEAAATAAGARLLRADCGTGQPEAMSLYTGRGYTMVEPRTIDGRTTRSRRFERRTHRQ
jgi:GNAT superfamily N-acetyltransferase